MISVVKINLSNRKYIVNNKFNYKLNIYNPSVPQLYYLDKIYKLSKKFRNEKQSHVQYFQMVITLKKINYDFEIV